MIYKAIDGLTKKIYLKKLGLSQGEYEWADSRGIKRNYLPTMIYLLLKSINQSTSIVVSKLTDGIYKVTLSNFHNNVKDLIHDISSN